MQSEKDLSKKEMRHKVNQKEVLHINGNLDYHEREKICGVKNSQEVEKLEPH